ncbi:MAG: preprotein translocase subunit SecY [Parcubacteria group bacterium CG10_big_fil_rev_8_21_14_0_10_36_14]|nr:MAG: preprotein translocase subunit SecY [Parcubacteria group bacterium CG10_big_fil_rev_8_21_14_0_10_36_14]
MLEKFTKIWKDKEVRNKILFVLGMLAVFRIAAHIPMPGVDVENLKRFFSSNQILGLVNIFSGGAMASFSIVALGVAPYITASIIFQLLSMIIPRLEALSKEDGGREKINQYTRYLTIPLAFLQSYAMINLISRSSRQIFSDLSPFNIFSMMITMTAGTIFLMWIGELISEKKVGNGISLLIFAGIVDQLPGALQQIIVTYDRAQMINLLAFIAIAVVTVIGVVMMNEAQRNIPISYAKRVRGNKMYGGVDSHLPLRVNIAGVIPIIFAISIILFPPMIAQFFVGAKTAWVAGFAEKVIELFGNQLLYGILYFVLVVAFTYFYTSVIFHPHQIAENLQKSGGFVPGIRPGENTAAYLKYVINRIIFAGALFLGALAILPLIMQQVTGLQSLVIGGTSLLIVVSVVIETVKQIESQLLMREYDKY